MADPLTQTWTSYAEVDHLAQMTQAVRNVSSDVTLTAETLHKWDLSGLGMIPGADAIIKSAKLDTFKVTGFFELIEGYTYGFMMLPLGYGSMSVQALNTLTKKEVQGEEHPVCIKEDIQADTLCLKPPRTIRQHTHELTQAWEGIKTRAENLYRVSVHKQRDIGLLDGLQQWVGHSLHAPFEERSADNQDQKRSLIGELQTLQVAIHNSIYNPPAPAEALKSEDGAHKALYETQQTCKAASDAYRRAIEHGFDLLNDQKTVERINHWRDRQQELDSDVQDEFAGYLDEASEFYSIPRNRLLRFNKPVPVAEWQPSHSTLDTMATPYTPLVYEAYAGLLGYLAVHFLPDASLDQDLLNGYLLPLLQTW
ncbi:MAG: hypothetical protein WD601_13870, partial [Pseudohongiellaceae bacterium]